MSVSKIDRRSRSELARVLVVDDEADIRELLDLTLVRMGLSVDCAGTVAEAKRFLERESYGLCLTDMRLPDGEGLEIVREIGAHYGETPVAVITAFGSADNAVAALKAGAFDYLAKPLALDQLRALIKSALSLPRGADTADGKAITATGGQLIGESSAMLYVREMIIKLARSQAPVYISGESGSGKELAARLIHSQGARSAAPFVPVNCGAIPENLMESEFFGYRKGAFTGADGDRDGFFQTANGGTLFLDEVADLPLSMQVKLLRAIQEKRVRKVGAANEEPVDVRIVSATHRKLKDCVDAATFRLDLYYPAECHRTQDAALARTPGRHSAARRGGAGAHVRRQSARTDRRSDARPLRLFLSGQRARAGEHSRAGNGPVRRGQDRSRRPATGGRIGGRGRRRARRRNARRPHEPHREAGDPRSPGEDRLQPDRSGQVARSDFPLPALSH